MSRPLPTSIRLDPDLKARLEAAAEADGRSLSNLVDRIIRAWLDEHPPLTPAAAEDVR